MAPFEGMLSVAFPHGQAIADRLRETAIRPAKDYVYGWRTARDLAQLAGSGATLWAMYKRKRIAVPLSVATAAVTAGLTAASAVFDAEPNAREDRTPEEALRDKIVRAIFDALPNVMGAATLAAVPATRKLLDQPLDLAPRDPSIPFTLAERARNIGALYAVYTMVGHWLEMLFCQGIKLGIVGGDYDRSNTMLWDWWLHPFPAEGIAGVLIAGGLVPLQKKLLAHFGGRVAPALALSFLANQVVCTSIDYFTGMVANRNYELWDYREMPFNFQGQICLQNSIVYTTAATLVTWLAYPARDQWLRRMPADLVNLLDSSLAAIYAFLCLTYFV